MELFYIDRKEMAQAFYSFEIGTLIFFGAGKIPGLVVRRRLWMVVSV